MRTALVALAVLAVPLSPFPAHAVDEPAPWKKHVINDRAPYEGAGAADFDGDGKIDIFSGDTFYQAPRWKRFKVRTIAPRIHAKYDEDFANIPLDVNGDGKLDLVTCTYFGKRLGWVENPGDPKKPWIEHDIDYPGASEACDLVDINGDGRVDLLPGTNNKIVWYELSRTEPPAPVAGQPAGKPDIAWKRHDVSDKGAGHGMGFGDVNGDGRVDLIGPHGFYEQPPKDGGEAWPFHPEFELGGASIMILGRDIDGDGLTDIVWGTAHGRGLQWLAQKKDATGKRSWTRADIDASMHQAHTTKFVDLDGSGDPWLVTGTRVYGHEVEAGDIEAPVIAAYRYDRAAKAWIKRVLYTGKGAANAPPEAKNRDALKDFERGTAGTGLYIEARDVDADGDLDLVCPGKSGLYLFENPRLGGGGKGKGKSR